MCRSFGEVGTDHAQPPSYRLDHGVAGIGDVPVALAVPAGDQRDRARAFVVRAQPESPCENAAAAAAVEHERRGAGCD